MIPLLSWARLLFLGMAGALVSWYVWMMYRAGDEK